MKNNLNIIASSYMQGNDALSLINIDLSNKEYKVLDSVSLKEPSFVIGVNNIIFTYDKFPLKIKVFKVENHKIKHLSSIDVPLKTLTHLVYNDKYNILYGASYADGSYFKVNYNLNTLRFEKMQCFYQGGKCHCVSISEDKEYLYITNIEQDRIYKYDNDLTLIKILELPKGIGPRHSIIYDKKIFVITEYSNELYVYDENSFKFLYSHSTLSTQIISHGGTLLFSKDHEYIYCSNRGEETIAIFKYNNKVESINNIKNIDNLDNKDNLDNNINIKYIESISCYGQHSRHMILSNCGKYIISCNKNSNDIAFIKLDNGKLMMKIPYQKVSCVYQL